MLQKFKNKALLWLTFLYLTSSACNVSEGPGKYSNEIKKKPDKYSEIRNDMNDTKKVLTEEGFQNNEFYQDGFIDSHLYFPIGRNAVTATIKDYAPLDGGIMGPEDTLFVKIFCDFYDKEKVLLKPELVSNNINNKKKDSIDVRRYDITSLNNLSDEDLNLLKDVNTLVIKYVEGKKELLKPFKRHPNFYVPKSHSVLDESRQNNGVRFQFAYFPDSSANRSFDISDLDKFDYEVSNKDLKKMIVDNPFADIIKKSGLNQYLITIIDNDQNYLVVMYRDVFPFDFTNFGAIGKEDVLISGKLDSLGYGTLYFDKSANGPGEGDAMYSASLFDSKFIVKYNYPNNQNLFSEKAFENKKMMMHIRNNYFQNNLLNFQDLSKNPNDKE